VGRGKRASVFERLYMDSSVRSQNYAYCQGGRARTQGVVRGRRIEEELMKKHAESEARKKQLRDQKEAELLHELRSAPQINPTSKQIAAAQKSDFVIKKKLRAAPQFSPPPQPSRPTPPQVPTTVSVPTQLFPWALDPRSPETERPPVLSSPLSPQANLRFPVASPAGLTADLRKKFSELLVPEDPEPTRPEPPIKQYKEKQTQSDPKLSLTAFASPVKAEVVATLMTDRSPTKRLFYMNSYDRNRYWSRLKEAKLHKQREARAETELSECTFRPVYRPNSANRSLNLSLPRSKSQGRTSSYTERYQLRREWRSRASSPQVRPV